MIVRIMRIFINKYTEIKNLCQKYGIPLIILRRPNCQNQQKNYTIIDVGSYLRQSTCVPYAEHLLVQMSERFEDQKIKYQSLWNLIPKYTVTPTSPLETDNLLELFQQNIGSKVVISPKIMRWKIEWKKQNVTALTKNAFDPFKVCNADLFPNVRNKVTINISATLTVTTVTSQRSFCTMQRLKTHIWSTMGEQR